MSLNRAVKVKFKVIIVQNSTWRLINIQNNCPSPSSLSVMFIWNNSCTLKLVITGRTVARHCCKGTSYFNGRLLGVAEIILTIIIITRNSLHCQPFGDGRGYPIMSLPRSRTSPALSSMINNFMYM